MAAKKKAAKAGKGAFAAGKAAKSNPYLHRLAEDEDLRENLKNAFESARTAIDRIGGKGAATALIDDKKTRNELKEAAHSLREAADTLRGAKKKKKARRRGSFLIVALVGGGLALALNEDLRKRALDMLFGAEEEFEYTPSTASGDAGAGSTSPPPTATGGEVSTPATTTSVGSESGDGEAPSGPVGTS